MDDRYVVIVGGEEVPSELEIALSAQGSVRRCPGQPHVYCPAVHGGTCALRIEARAAVVYLAGEHEYFGPGRWHCVTHGLIPAVAVLEGADHAPRSRTGFGVVGSARGPEGVLTALAGMLDRDERA